MDNHKYLYRDYVIFAFRGEETGRKLSDFYFKHTGKRVDFNAIRHYKNGVKLLRFSIPLGHFETWPISCTGFNCGPRSIDEFVEWYEERYLKSVKEGEKK